MGGLVHKRFHSPSPLGLDEQQCVKEALIPRGPVDCHTELGCPNAVQSKLSCGSIVYYTHRSLPGPECVGSAQRIDSFGGHK